MANIIWENFKGLSDSKWSGVRGSFYKMVGLNIHSKPGVITVNQKLSKLSGSTITAFCRVGLSVSDGNKLWFSYTDGKIWLQDTSDAFTLVYTTSPAAGTAGCLGAAEYNAYVYWGTQSRLHRMPVANIGTAAGWTANAVPDWNTFGITDTEFHPMAIVNGSLFIGDGNQIASVNSSASFTANDLDIVDPLRVKVLVPYDIDVLIGTIVASSVGWCDFIRWDTVQTSWQFSEHVMENGINSALYKGNMLLVQAGTYGNFYYYDGERLQPFKRIPGTWTPTRYGEVYPNSVGNFQGIPVFGFSNSPDAANSTGDPADQGIYTIGNYSKDYDVVINGPEYVISENVVAAIELGAILVEGNDMYVAWKNGSTYGVDSVDYTAKYTGAYLETPVMTILPRNKTSYTRFFANYSSLPASTSLTFKYDNTHTGSYTPLTTIDDTEIKQLYADDDIQARAIQMRVDFTVSSNSSPEVEAVGVAVAEGSDAEKTIEQS